MIVAPERWHLLPGLGIEFHISSIARNPFLWRGKSFSPMLDGRESLATRTHASDKHQGICHNHYKCPSQPRQQFPVCRASRVGSRGPRWQCLPLCRLFPFSCESGSIAKRITPFPRITASGEFMACLILTSFVIAVKPVTNGIERQQ